LKDPNLGFPELFQGNASPREGESGEFLVVPEADLGVESGGNVPESGPFLSETGGLVEKGVCSQKPQARIVIRCDPEFVGWVQGLADHCSINVTQCVVQGLIRMSEMTAYHLRVPRRFTPKNPSRRRSYPRPV
jgi:hypothetical protein